MDTDLLRKCVEDPPLGFRKWGDISVVVLEERVYVDLSLTVCILNKH